MTKINFNQEAPQSTRYIIHKKKKLKRASKNNKIKIEFSSFQISKQKTKKNENNKSYNNIINTIEDFEKYYEKNIDNTFKNSASRIMKNLIKKDIKNIQINNIEKIIDVKERISLLNYLFNLIDINQLESEIYFLTIDIFDTFLQKSEEKIDKREGVKLLLTSLYIALKFESVNYISSDWISCFKYKEYQFTPLELEEEENLIYDKIGLLICNNCIIEYFNICIVDYKCNYNNYYKNIIIDNDNNSQILVKIENFFLNMLKLLPLDFELFYLNKNFELIITCMIYSFDLLRNYVNNVNNEFSIFHEWILTFINSMNYDIKNIKKIYKQMERFYNNLKINISELWENLKF